MEVPPPADLRSRTFKAATWSVFSQVSTRLVSPVVFLILARILTPEDYGVAAVATMVISLCQIITDAGLGKAIVQRQRAAEDINAVASNAFWMNLVISVVACLILILLAGPLARLFSEPRSANVIRLQSLQLILGAFSTVQIALYQRSLDFKKLFWVQVISALVPGAACIPMAASGMGYWALVVGSLAGSLSTSIWLWLRSSWRPTTRVHNGSLGDLLRFGVFAMSEALSGWIFNWADSILVGIFLSSAELGIYRTGLNFVGILSGLLIAPVIPVIFRAFSLIQNEPARLTRAYLKASRLMMAVSVCTGIALLGGFDLWPSLVFTKRWHGIENVLFYFSMLFSLGGLSYANSELLRAGNRPDVPVKMNMFCLAFYVVGYWFSLQKGFQVFLFVRYLLAILTIPVHALVLDKVMRIRVSQYIGNVAPSLSVFVATAFLLNWIGDGNWAWKLPVSFVAIIAVGLFNRQVLLETMRSLRVQLVPRRQGDPS